MHLLAPLAAGIKGAESGTAEIFTRGTSTRATYFTDFEGTSSVATGADVDLDSNGGAAVYVNSFVTVVVKKSGSTIRTFTDGASSSAVEVLSQSFLGTDPTSGASGAGNPIGLKEVLDKWLTSAGTTNFNILKDGSASTLQAALGGTLYFNVKDYGAVGDGSTDDLSSIDAAIAAATVGNGTVYFPGGTYNVSSSVAITGSGVSLLGSSSSASIIKLDSASNDTAITFLGADGHHISHLGFSCAQANSGSFISGGGSGIMTIANCRFDGTNVTGILVDVDSTSALSRANVLNCEFVNLPVAVASVSGLMAEAANPTSYMTVTNCNFRIPALLNATTGYAVAISAGTVSGCYFDAGDLTLNAAMILVSQTSRVQSSVSCYGNVANNNDSGTPTLFRLNPEETTDTEGFIESGNVSILDGWLGTNTPTGETSVSSITPDGHAFMSRVGKMFRTSHTSGALTLDVSGAEFHIVQQTDNSAYTLNMTLMPVGNRLTLMLMNTSGGATGTITWGANVAEHDTMTTTSFTVPNNENQVWEFISAPVNLSDGTDVHRWVMLSDTLPGAHQV